MTTDIKRIENLELTLKCPDVALLGNRVRDKETAFRLSAQLLRQTQSTKFDPLCKKVWSNFDEYDAAMNAYLNAIYQAIEKRD